MIYPIMVVSSIWTFATEFGICWERQSTQAGASMTKLATIPTVSERIPTVDSLKKAKADAVKNTKEPNKFDFKTWIKRSFNEFAANTALHGYNHIVRQDTAQWER